MDLLYEPLDMVVKPGSMLSKVALIGLSGSDKIVKLIFCPARTLVISPSAICILLVMLPKLAICTTVGEV